MNEFTAKGLSAALEQKGYDQLFTFYAPLFDFFDRLEAGLQRVEQAFEPQSRPSKFSLSFYPVWENECQPYVSGYMQCSCHHGSFSIESLDLTYCRGRHPSELLSTCLQRPSLADIPDKAQLQATLSGLCRAPQKIIKHKTKIK